MLFRKFAINPLLLWVSLLALGFSVTSLAVGVRHGWDVGWVQAAGSLLVINAMLITFGVQDLRSRNEADDRHEAHEEEKKRKLSKKMKDITAWIDDLFLEVERVRDFLATENNIPYEIEIPHSIEDYIRDHELGDHVTKDSLLDIRTAIGKLNNSRTALSLISIKRDSTGAEIGTRTQKKLIQVAHQELENINRCLLQYVGNDLNKKYTFPLSQIHLDANELMSDRFSRPEHGTNGAILSLPLAENIDLSDNNVLWGRDQNFIQDIVEKKDISEIARLLRQELAYLQLLLIAENLRLDILQFMLSNTAIRGDFSRQILNHQMGEDPGLDYPDGFSRRSRQSTVFRMRVRQLLDGRFRPPPLPQIEKPSDVYSNFLGLTREYCGDAGLLYNISINNIDVRFDAFDSLTMSLYGALSSHIRLGLLLANVFMWDEADYLVALVDASFDLHTSSDDTEAGRWEKPKLYNFLSHAEIEICVNVFMNVAGLYWLFAEKIETAYANDDEVEFADSIDGFVEFSDQLNRRVEEIYATEIFGSPDAPMYRAGDVIGARALLEKIVQKLKNGIQLHVEHEFEQKLEAKRAAGMSVAQDIQRVFHLRPEHDDSLDLLLLQLDTDPVELEESLVRAFSDERGDEETEAALRRFKALMYGPPGSGKSEFAHHLCSKLNLTLASVNYSDLASKWVGETEQNIDLIFEEAIRRETALLFDEADSLVGSRQRASQSWERTQTSEFLIKLDKHPLPVFMTTNFVDDLDEALSRRIPLIIGFDYLATDKLERAFRKILVDAAPPSRLFELEYLTPGYFVAVRNHAELRQQWDPDWLVNELEKFSADNQRRLGIGLGGTIGFRSTREA